MFEWMLKYFEQRPMRKRRKCKMQNFISFPISARFIIYQKCPFKGQLSLEGYAESSVPGELGNNTY